MSAQLAPAPMTAARARTLTRKLRTALSSALVLLAEVHDGRAWEVLGHASWEAYCAAELPELAQLRLPLEDRRAAVAGLRGRGMSTRAIAAPLGLSVGTVHADLKAADVKLATVTSLDGRQRPGASVAVAKPDTAPPKVHRVLELLAAAGPDGLTVRDVCRRTRWHHGQASAALSRLAAAGRITYVAPAKRGQLGAYVR